MIKKDRNKMAFACIPDFEESCVDIYSFVEFRALSVQSAVPIDRDDSLRPYLRDVK